MQRRNISAVVASAAAALLAVGVSTGLAGGRPTDGVVAGGIDTGSAIVQLKGDPLSTYVKTKPAPGKKIDFNSNTVKSYRAQLNALRNDFKQWLRQNASAANVTGEFDISLNAVAVKLNGTPLTTIRSAPMVQNAQYEALYTPQVIDPDLTLINAFTAWAGLTPTPGGAHAGEGVKVAIIDTGIDTRHPCFGSGPLNGGTNAKVIFAGVFNMRAKVAGFTAADLQGHGTHVAGTVACQYGLTNASTSVGGVTVGYGVNGVAPAARLGNFNVFPDGVAGARSEDILNALDSAFEQGFDIANMSLGGGSSGIQDLLMDAVDDLDQAGFISAIAAGNSGPGFNTVESPGAAARGLTAGAVTVGHFIGVSVTDNFHPTSFAAAAGDFAPSAPVTAPLMSLGSNLACSALTAGSLTSKIALISRGVCTFSTKIRNAQAAGAVGAVIRNNQNGPPISMAQDGTASQPTIPGVMISRADGLTLNTGHDTHSTTIAATRTYLQNAAQNDFLAAFSSRGPTDVDFRVKPDVTSPGVNVLSSQPNFVCATPPCWAFFQGTSMATPHLAGAAAVVLGQHPGWASWEVRSAIVNTADQGTVQNALVGFPPLGVNDIGSGRLNLDSAVDAAVALDPVSVSFGAVPSGSGQSDSRSVNLSTLSGSGPYTVEVTNQTGVGVSFGASISGNTITVTMSALKGIPAGSRQGTLRVKKNGTEIAHAAVFAFIK